MLFSNKRGVAIGTVVVLVLILFAAFALFAGIRLWGITTGTLVDREACRMSVLVKTRSIIAGVEDFPWHVGLKCPTVIVDVSKEDEGLIKDLFSGSKNKKKIEGIDFPVKSVKIEKESDLKKVIADEMYDTWYKFGAGKLNFFGKYSGEKKCIIGSIFKFSDKVKKGFKIENFETYLLKEKIPGKELTYYDYFTQGEGILFSKDEAGKIDISTDKDLAIIYMLQQTGTATHWKVFAIVGATLGLVAVTVATFGFGATISFPVYIGFMTGVVGGSLIVGASGEATYRAIMLPIAYEKIREMCDTIE